MLEIKYVRQNLSEVYNCLEKRGYTADLVRFNGWRQRGGKYCLKSRRSGIKKRRIRRDRGHEKKGEDADEIVVQMRDVSGRIKILEKSLAENDERPGF